VAQCLHEGETQAVLLRKREPVGRRAVPGRALYPEFSSKGTRLRSVISGKALYPGAQYPGNGLCPWDLGKRAL